MRKPISKKPSAGARPSRRNEAKPGAPSELELLRLKLVEAQETLQAIRGGDVDALVVTGAQGEQVYTLKDAAHPYQHLVEEMNEGALTLSANGDILYANARFADMVGVPLEQVLGAALGRFVATADRVRLQPLLRRGLKRRCRDEVTLAAGQVSIPVLLSLRAMAIDGVVYLTALVTDLTERKQAEERVRALNAELEQRVQERTAELEAANVDLGEQMTARQRIANDLQQSERKANDLVRYAPTAIYEIDFRGPRFKSVNDAMCAMSGYTRAELMGMNPLDLLDAESQARFRARIPKMLAGEPVDSTVGYTAIVKGGRKVYALINATAVYEEGKPVGALVVAHDLTARKQTEDEIRRLNQELERRAQDLEAANAKLKATSDGIQAANDALHATNTRLEATEHELRKNQILLQAVMEGTSDPIFVKDRDSRILLANPALARVAGKPLTEIIGKTDTEYYGDAAIGQMLREHDLQIMARSENAIFEETVRTPEGYRTFLSAKGPYLSPAGEIIGTIGVSRDITERKRAEESQERLLAENQRRAADLESANRELDAFAYSVSHDLRAPLGFIQQFAQVLAEENTALLSAASQYYLQLIQDNAAAMTRLIEGLLLFSRTTRAPVLKQRVDMDALVCDVWGELGSTPGDRQIELRVGSLPPAQADPVLLRQVWVNLLSNALKFTRGRAQTLIEIGYAPAESGGAYFVKDNGVGFDMAKAEQLFVVFRRLHAAEEYEGTGVGLAIVERIVRRHGGRIWAQAAVDQGATFYFNLGSDDT